MDLSYDVCKFSKENLNEIISSQKFKGIKLLVPSERGRVTRSGTNFSGDKDAYKTLIYGRFNKYVKYLEIVLADLIDRFEPWRE